MFRVCRCASTIFKPKPRVFQRLRTILRRQVGFSARLTVSGITRFAGRALLPFVVWGLLIRTE